MRVNTSKLLPQKITIINRLKSKDNASKRDIFYKKVLDNCVWDSVRIAHQNGKEVYYTNGSCTQIPTEQKYEYKGYNDWVKDAEKSYTLSLGDYVVLGEVAEDITADNITDVLNKYSSNFKISTINFYVSDGIGFDSNNFLMKYANIYYVEGD